MCLRGHEARMISGLRKGARGKGLVQENKKMWSGSKNARGMDAKERCDERRFQSLDQQAISMHINLQTTHDF